MEKKTITLYKSDRESETITFGEFYQQMIDEINTYDELGRKEELMNQPMLIEILDAEGQIILGKITGLIGWLESGNVVTVANYDDIYFERSNNETK